VKRYYSFHKETGKYLKGKFGSWLSSYRGFRSTLVEGKKHKRSEGKLGRRGKNIETTLITIRVKKQIGGVRERGAVGNSSAHAKAGG